MSNFLVCVTDQRHTSYDIEKRILEEAGIELRLCSCETPADIAEQCKDADAVMLDLVPMTKEAISALQRCKVINRYGVGYDNVDVRAARAAGIRVTYVPDYCMEDVSDHAMALMLACLRHIAMKDRRIRAGEWNIQGQSFRLADKTLGLIGAGRIARALARKVSGFGLREIVAYDPYVSAEELQACGIRKAELDEVLGISDFVSLHLHANSETAGFINKTTLGKMKETAILINVSRGALVNDEDLLKALKEHRILAAGLDTHNHEPLGADSPYCALDNVILTDHAAYATKEGVEELKTKSAINIVNVLTGKEPLYEVK